MQYEIVSENTAVTTMSAARVGERSFDYTRVALSIAVTVSVGSILSSALRTGCVTSRV